MPCFVYILANKRNGTLYTGVTNDIARRVAQHREGGAGSFSSRYGTRRLVYVETHDDVEQAIVREKRIEKWRRGWKLELIERHNPGWRDLYEDINR